MKKHTWMLDRCNPVSVESLQVDDFLHTNWILDGPSKSLTVKPPPPPQKKIRAEKQLAELHDQTYSRGAVENNRPEEADSLRGLNKYQLMCFTDRLDEKIACGLEAED
ncbi:hypothetical protein Dimus_026299 [Dionaea muscipula]